MILIFIGITLEPKNGLEMKKADSLIEHKKNLNKYSINEFNSIPGNPSIGW